MLQPEAGGLWVLGHLQSKTLFPKSDQKKTSEKQHPSETGGLEGIKEHQSNYQDIKTSEKQHPSKTGRLEGTEEHQNNYQNVNSQN